MCLAYLEFGQSSLSIYFSIVRISHSDQLDPNSDIGLTENDIQNHKKQIYTKVTDFEIVLTGLGIE